jgi:RNA polymerase sigma-70 factor (ECF subfamily)
MEKCEYQDEITIKFLAAAAPDDVLVAAAKRGDRPAFTELWQRHSQCAFIAAYRITKNRADAEDSAQDAWMKAYLHLETFDCRAAFSTWVTRIAINSALMMLRKKRYHPETPLEAGEGDAWRYWEIPDRSLDAETRLIACESVTRLRREFSRLNPGLRKVIEIRESNDASLKEIASLSGITVAATKSRLMRARRILQRAWDNSSAA